MSTLRTRLEWVTLNFCLGFMLGWTLRSADAWALDCSDEALGDFVEVRRTTGDQPIESQSFWRKQAAVFVSTDPFQEVLNIFTDHVESKDDILFLEGEDEP